MGTMKTVIITLTVTAVIAGAALVGFAYSGLYNIAADDPHSAAVYWLANTVRKHSVSERAAGIQAPNLQDPELIREGAGQYAAMCSSCHLAPGFDEGETRAGLYPEPPKLYRSNSMSAEETFWVIKHGIKMSGMPAWGTSHDDQTLWAVTAFVMRLPNMTPEQYKTLVIKAPRDEDMTMMPMPSGAPEKHHHSDHD